MLGSFKKSLYFPLAKYFRFFAQIKLNSWKPYVIVVTGSSGKTTLLHLLESQVGERAKYSHHANSSYGIPFDILGLKRKTLHFSEWIYLFFAAPLGIFKPNPREKFYVVETDCDRPREGKFLATLLKPNITLWTNSTRTHSMNFDKLVKNGEFDSVDEAISHEYGYFLEYTSELAIVNGDSANIRRELPRCKAKIINSKIDSLTSYKASLNEIEFDMAGENFKFKYLLPKSVYYSLSMCISLLKYLNLPFDKSFAKFVLPAGRSLVFKGIKKTTLIDSTYNANLDSMSSVLSMFESIVYKNKWAVIGDMLEQGESERREHEKLAEILLRMKLEKIILIGPRVKEYVFPKMKNDKWKIGNSDVIAFEYPDEVLMYLKEHIKGEELILFKGARFLEGVIENLLADKNDAQNLARREKVWEKRRAKFGL